MRQQAKHVQLGLWGGLSQPASADKTFITEVFDVRDFVKIRMNRSAEKTAALEILAKNDTNKMSS